ncbi:MAG: hypothetical protein RMJ00_03600 [Nitrososphaerota archaeon]|nr:hypothetical protein [Candidatus Bathyarchaeota archaeon]MCX8162583.1 hypothetical protein [Candidatus Bathyarchaeota archaeon]MDW8061764.1 hypothetical protein [Nitrososphaerota archaeon]
MKLNLRCSQGRIEIIAELFSRLGFDGITCFVYLEPEYLALKKVYEEFNVQPRFLNLIALSAGTIDFQLGFGGADRFWNALYETAKMLKNLNGVEHVESLMLQFLRDPVNAKFLNIKNKRIKKIFR